MFRGTQNGRVDAKGRLKLPAVVKRNLRQAYGQTEVFVTSLMGDLAMVYPITEWEEVEAGLNKKQSGPDGVKANSKNRMLFQANHWGLQGRVDAQGRILVPQPLRASAGMKGPVKIQWQSNHMLVMSEDRFNQAIKENALSESDLELAATLGL